MLFKLIVIIHRIVSIIICVLHLLFFLLCILLFSVFFCCCLFYLFVCRPKAQTQHSPLSGSFLPKFRPSDGPSFSLYSGPITRANEAQWLPLFSSRAQSYAWLFSMQQLNTLSWATALEIVIALAGGWPCILIISFHRIHDEALAL